MPFNTIFELLDYVHLVYFSFPELNREFAHFCEYIDMEIDYPDGLEGILNDFYRILGEQYESDFFDETPEAFDNYMNNFQLINEIVMNLYGKFAVAPYRIINYPVDGEMIYHGWKTYLRDLGHELEQNHYIGGIHHQNLYYLIFFISNNLWEFSFPPISAGKFNAIHQTFDEYMNPFIDLGRDYKQMIKDLIEEQHNDIRYFADVLDKILEKILNHQTLLALEKTLLKYTDNPVILRKIEEILPKNHEIVLFIQKTVEISETETLFLWL